MTEDSPFHLLQQTAMSYALPRSLHVVAELGVADHLDEEPKDISALAQAVGADTDALTRVLRLLSAHGVFQMRGSRFAHTAASRLLRTDHPQSQRPIVRMLGRNWQLRCYEELEYSVRTGRPASEKVLPSGFAYFGEHPEEGRIFDAAMTAMSYDDIPSILAAYDFSVFQSIADIGGGHGHVLRAILAAAPNAKGVLFDLPHVTESVMNEATPRLTIQTGDFFKDIIPASDCYILKDVIHDWNDADSIRILSAIRRSASARAKLLLVESLIPDDAGPSFVKLFDVHMMLVGGKQRTRLQFEQLYQAAGFVLERVVPTQCRLSIVEGAVA
jgi:hypothetical protein